MASSSSVYGGREEYVPFSETNSTLAASPYGASKLAAERYAAASHEVYDLPTVALRYFTRSRRPSSTPAISSSRRTAANTNSRMRSTCSSSPAGPSTPSERTAGGSTSATPRTATRPNACSGRAATPTTPKQPRSDLMSRAGRPSRVSLLNRYAISAGSVRSTTPLKSPSKLSTESTACDSTRVTVVASVKLSSWSLYRSNVSRLSRRRRLPT